MTGCGGYSGICNLKHMRAYEGGFAVGDPDGLLSSDRVVAITGANDSSPCTLETASGNGLGAADGASVTLSSISETGGTYWTTLAAAGSLTVGNGTSTAIPLKQSGRPVNCSSDDTLNSAKLTYNGSEKLH